MDREQMLGNLAEEGANCASDYHDGVDGWFGWGLARDDEGNILTVTFEIPDDEGGIADRVVRRWRLTPIE